MHRVRATSRTYFTPNRLNRMFMAQPAILSSLSHHGGRLNRGPQSLHVWLAFLVLEKTNNGMDLNPAGDLQINGWEDLVDDINGRLPGRLSEHVLERSISLIEVCADDTRHKRFFSMLEQFITVKGERKTLSCLELVPKDKVTPCIVCGGFSRPP